MFGDNKNIKFQDHPITCEQHPKLKVAASTYHNVALVPHFIPHRMPIRFSTKTPTSLPVVHITMIKSPARSRRSLTRNLWIFFPIHQLLGMAIPTSPLRKQSLFLNSSAVLLHLHEVRGNLLLAQGQFWGPQSWLCFLSFRCNAGNSFCPQKYIIVVHHP